MNHRRRLSGYRFWLWFGFRLRFLLDVIDQVGTLRTERIVRIVTTIVVFVIVIIVAPTITAAISIFVIRVSISIFVASSHDYFSSDSIPLTHLSRKPHP